jgi:hypothetical protein
MRRTLRWLVMVGIGYAIVTYSPDLARYLRMRQMSAESARPSP